MKPSKHIFLSYRSIEVEFALQLAADLKNAGINLWMDRLDIKPGDDWLTMLGSAVNDCAAMIPVLTPEYVTSKYCKRELARADRLERPIFPVLLRALPDIDLPLEMERRQFIDFSEWRNEKIYRERLAQLVAILKQQLGDQITHATDPEMRYLTTLIAEMETYKGLLDYVVTQPDSTHNADTRPRPSFLKAWTRHGAFTLLGDDLEDKDKPLSGINEAVEQYPRFVLLGAAGTGKTTILQHLALDAARARQKTPRHAPIPLLLKLMHWLDEPTPTDFIRANWTLDTDPIKLLAKGEIALYLDGLSELPPNKAAALRVWLQSAHAPQRVVITCRTEGYTDEYDLGIPVIAAGEMDREAVNQFILEYLGKSDADALINRMTPHLYELAGNPFLLNALILAHKLSNKRDLPHTAGSLLKLLTTQLWDLECVRQPSDLHTFTELELALTELAFAMTESESSTYVSIEYALQYIGSRSLLDTTVNANFLEIDGDSVRFFYQPLQEYFAARGLARMGLLPRLSKPRFNSYGLRVGQKWDRTIIMLAGISDDPNVLLDEVNDVDPFLALECIAAGTQVSERIHEETMQRVLNYVPDGRTEALRLLVQLQHISALPVALDAMREGTWGARRQANTLFQNIKIVPLSGVTHILQDLESEIRQAASGALRQLGEGAVPTLLKLLRDEKWFVRRGAAWGLKEIRDRAAVPALVEALYDKDTLVCAEAAGALGWIRDEAAVPDLLKALRHKNWRVRKAVANGLAWIGQPAQAGLLEAITDRNEEVRRLAIEALKTSRENMVLRAILRASYDENIEVRGAAIEALKEWGEDAIVLRRLTEALSDTARSRLSKMRITEIAVKVLEALGNKDANRILERWREGDLRPDTPSKKSAVVAHDRIKKGSRGQNAFTQHVEALRDSDWQVRRKAVQEIVVIDSAAALPEILPLLKDSDNQVRIAVVKSLAIIGSDGALRGLMQALNDKDPLVSDAAADALKHIGKPALPDLISALRVDNENVRGSVIEILSKIDDATAVPELVECLKDERKPWLHDVRVCDLAAKALEKIGTPDAVKAVRQWRESQHPTMEVGALTPEKLEQQSSEQRQLLQNMLDELRSSEWHVRLNAAKALREYAKLLHHTKEPQVVSRLMEAMDDQNWEVRWAVTEALAWIGDPAAVSALIKHLDDKNWTVRVALIRALLEIGDKQSASYVVPYLKDENANVREAAAETLGVLQYANAVGELMKALSDSERFVRLQAAAALGNIGDKRAVPTMIKLLRESDLEMRWFIVYALGRIGDASAVPILIEHLTDTAMPQWEEKQRICDLAVAALETIGTADAKNAALQWRQQYS